MPKIVILGSCRFEPYEITFVPEKIKEKELYNTEEGYKLASIKCYSAIDEADLVLIYNPDRIGEHTLRDMEYAKKKKKKIWILQ